MHVPAIVAADDNLKRAWRWIRSNPDRAYKSYCADMYSRFAVNDDSNIRRLRKRLLADTYRPEHACKLMFPKQSGVLRPYSILTVEDQIVYQAMVNLIAERMAPSARQYYNKTNFGHMYAGTRSIWFYKKWSDGYGAFNRAARNAFNEGKTFSASFDLTACYDSLDHGVLSHFLRRLRFTPDFIKSLTEMLSFWTATQSRIYQNHGIPQGPLSSGLLSEVVLSIFNDSARIEDLVLLRYVDDIKLFASDEMDLRKEIMWLDIRSKDVGLFPQASKVDIHKVEDIEDELKQISSPIETAITKTGIDQKVLRTRLKNLSPRDRISNATRFKYLLGCALPHHAINAKLLRLAKKRPDLVPNVMRYLRRYSTLPDSVTVDLLDWLRNWILYPATTTEIVETLRGRVSEDKLGVTLELIETYWKPVTMDAALMASVGCYLIETGTLNPRRTLYAVSNAKEWWTKCKLIEALSHRHYSEAFLEDVLNRSIRDANCEVALCGAYKLIAEDLKVAQKEKPIHPTAHTLLLLFDKTRGRATTTCGVELALHEFIGTPTNVNWKLAFGTSYKDAQRQALLTFAMAKVNASSFVNAAEVFNDWLAQALHIHTPALGTYQLGHIAWDAKPNSKIATVYPATHKMISTVHDWRYCSPLSHPHTAKTKTPTKALRFSVITEARRLYRNILVELTTLWPCP